MPRLVYDPLNLIGMMLLPLALLILGHNLSRFRLNSLPTTLLASFLRVGVGLGLGLLVAEWLGLSGVFRSVVVLDSAMPAATTAVILATKYDNERELISSVVSLTTLASLVIIPFLLHVLA
jgi:predicted permease